MYDIYVYVYIYIYIYSVWESAEKIKNLKLTKMAQNRNRAKTKCHMSFFAFHISHLEIVLIDS